MKNREKKLVAMLLVCVGLLILALFVLVINPIRVDMHDKANEQTRLKNEAQAQLKLAESLDADEINNELSNLKARVPNSLELPNVINRIDELAVANNLVWLQGSPEDSTTVTTTTAPATDGQTDGTVAAQGQAPQLDRHDFTIVVNGNRGDFLKFVAGLTDKKIGRIIVVNTLDISFKPEQGPDAIEATLKLQVVGWQSGSSIDSSGCTQAGITDTAKETDDPECNQTNVKGKGSD